MAVPASSDSSAILLIVGGLIATTVTWKERVVERPEMLSVTTRLAVAVPEVEIGGVMTTVRLAPLPPRAKTLTGRIARSSLEQVTLRAPGFGPPMVKAIALEAVPASRVWLPMALIVGGETGRMVTWKEVVLERPVTLSETRTLAVTVPLAETGAVSTRLRERPVPENAKALVGSNPALVLDPARVKELGFGPPMVRRSHPRPCRRRWSRR